MKCAAIIVGILFCASSFSLMAQDLPDNTKQQLENLAELTEEETENDELIQELGYLMRERLNLNAATREELQQFPFLTGLQIQSFLQYRLLLGNLVSLYELQSVPAWDIHTIQKLLPFVRVGQVVSLKRDFLSRLREGDHALLLRSSRIVEKSKGYNTDLDNHYPGGRNQHFLRYRYQHKNLLQYGVTAEQDAGEPFFKPGKSKGFDFYSVHFFARNIGTIKSIALGDYTVNLGQGLIQWQSLAFKKSSEAMNIKRQSPVLKPYSSAGEIYFNRGAAATLQKGRWEATLFGSIKNISASTDMDPGGREIFTSFLASGLHRTQTEIRNKNNVQQRSFGGNLAYRHQNFSIGLNGIQYQFSKPFLKRDEPYNFFAWSGDVWRNASVDYSVTHKNIHLFGEAALDKNLNKAFINGAMISVDPKIDISVLHRHISEQYAAVYGNAFTENIQPSNESGLSAGITIRPVNTIRLNAYADFYSFPWLKFRTDAPGGGKDFLMQLSYEPNKLVSLYSRYRYESKQINQSGDDQTMNFIIAKPRQNWRVHFSYELSSRITIRSRVDAVWYDKKGKDPEEGFLIFTEIHYKSSSKFSGNLRLQHFETDGYNSRLYAYENDVLFRYSTPAFFDKGMRYYANLNFDVNKKISLWFRWAQTIYTNKDLIGSGLDEISGNKRSEVRLQALCKF